VLPAEEPDVAIVVLPGVVTGQEPVAREAERGLLGLVPVAEEERGVAARDAEHALRAARDFRERLRIEELHLVAGLHEAGRAGPDRPRARLAEVVRALGHA